MTEDKNLDDLQEKIEVFHKRVYALGGGVTSSEDNFAIVSLPGIVTKFEPIDAAIERLNRYDEKSHK